MPCGATNSHAEVRPYWQHPGYLMAAALAQYATTHAGEERGPSPWTAALLTVLTPGLGHLYIGQPRRGAALFCMVLVADTLLMFALMGVLARFWMFAICLALLLGLWLYIISDASGRAARMGERPQHAYNRWPFYAGAAVLAWLITAIPCIYASNAKASGQLGYFTAINASMAPTLRAGEYFLADATYYHGRLPSRGDVVVYVHPKQPDIHYIKRIVAMEGDRIAIKGGRAIVNGIAVEEPYVNPGPPEAPFANMVEMRVPPGHVFVLGDNRADSVDSRNDVAHGPVPTANLIGRVTDIAFSHDLSRMGRWIGTPSHL
jgi:signal peptidase I